MPNNITNRLILRGDLEQIYGIFHLTDVPITKKPPRPVRDDDEADDEEADSDLDNDMEKEEYFSLAVTIPLSEGNDNEGRKQEWGTKWDCYGTKPPNRLDDNTVELFFYTAWSAPDEWFCATAELHSSFEMRLTWVDEDYPNSGILEAKEGTLVRNDCFEHTREAFDFVKEEFPKIYKESGGDEYRDQFLREQEEKANSWCVIQ